MIQCKHGDIRTCVACRGDLKNYPPHSSAIISDCGKYRYVLKRQIPSVLRWVRPMLFVMLNPSTADAVENDPTIRRCIRFAEREGCTELTVVNLFAFRATKPKDLVKAEDPIGPENNRYIMDEINAHRQIGFLVAAWGAHKFAKKRMQEVLDMTEGKFLCLGRTKKDRLPRHPLFLPGDTPLEIYEGL